MKVDVDPDYAADVASTGKRERSRLAKSELWMLACQWAYGHANDVGDKDDETIPYERWPDDDPLKDLGRRYGLGQYDIERLLNQISEECVTRAMHCGYEGAWV